MFPTPTGQDLETRASPELPRGSQARDGPTTLLLAPRPRRPAPPPGAGARGVRACACVRAGEREGDQGCSGAAGGRLGAGYLVELVAGRCCWVCGGARARACAFTRAGVSESGGAGRGRAGGALLRGWMLADQA